MADRELQGEFIISSGDYNFYAEENEHLRIAAQNEFGIGTSSPTSTVHIEGGTHLSFSDEGFLRVGITNHIAFDACRNEHPLRNATFAALN